MAETPRMSTATSAHSTYGMGEAGGMGNAISSFTNIAGHQFNTTVDHELERRLNAGVRPIANIQRGVPMAAQVRRIVQVFIADSNENVPLDDCVLYKGEQKLTDATDQELFFELDIKSILDKHNEKRTKVVDKKVKDRTEYLEPAKVRDLKMVVVTVANL